MTQQELLQTIEQAAAEGWEELDLSDQQLTVLPPEIGKLIQLKVLRIGDWEYLKKGKNNPVRNQLTILRQNSSCLQI